MGIGVISTTDSKRVENGIRETIAKLETEVNSIASALFATEEFSKAAIVAAEVQVRVQKLVDRHMAQQLVRLNMPSRDDINALGEQLMSIDKRLLSIEDRLAELSPKRLTGKGNRPPRTKRPEVNPQNES